MVVTFTPIHNEAITMKRHKTPSEKKALAYKKDYVLTVEYPNAFRAHWPRKKAAAARKERRHVRQRLTEIASPQASDERPDFPLKPVRRDQVQKWPSSVTALGSIIPQRHYWRVARIAWNFFKQPYQRALHQERFSIFLSEITRGKTAYSSRVARLFAELLDPPALHVHAEFAAAGDRRAEWLQAFFRDEPAWEQQLRNWIADSQ
jgi:hypothetical protein